MFNGQTAWFSISVRRKVRRLWVDNGGRLSDLSDAQFIFSQDTESSDTLRVFDSEAYLEEHLAVFHPNYIKECVKQGNTSKVILGKYFFPPADVQAIARDQLQYQWDLDGNKSDENTNESSDEEDPASKSNVLNKSKTDRKEQINNRIRASTSKVTSLGETNHVRQNTTGDSVGTSKVQINRETNRTDQNTTGDNAGTSKVQTNRETNRTNKNTTGDNAGTSKVQTNREANRTNQNTTGDNAGTSKVQSNQETKCSNENINRDNGNDGVNLILEPTADKSNSQGKSVENVRAEHGKQPERRSRRQSLRQANNSPDSAETVSNDTQHENDKVHQEVREIDNKSVHKSAEKNKTCSANRDGVNDKRAEKNKTGSTHRDVVNDKNLRSTDADNHSGKREIPGSSSGIKRTKKNNHINQHEDIYDSVLRLDVLAKVTGDLQDFIVGKNGCELVKIS